MTLAELLGHVRKTKKGEKVCLPTEWEAERALPAGAQPRARQSRCFMSLVHERVRA